MHEYALLINIGVASALALLSIGLAPFLAAAAAPLHRLLAKARLVRS